MSNFILWPLVSFNLGVRASGENSVAQHFFISSSWKLVIVSCNFVQVRAQSVLRAKEEEDKNKPATLSGKSQEVISLEITVQSLNDKIADLK